MFWQLTSKQDAKWGRKGNAGKLSNILVYKRKSVVIRDVSWFLKVPATWKVSERKISLDNCSCWQAEMGVSGQTCNLAQSQHAATGRNSPSADYITPGTCGWHKSTSFGGLLLLLFLFYINDIISMPFRCDTCSILLKKCECKQTNKTKQKRY